MGGQHQLEKGTSVSEDAGPQRGLDCEIPHRLGRRTKHFFMGVWKPLPSRRVLKTLRGSPKGKAQGEQYLLGWAWAVTLGAGLGNVFEMGLYMVC